MCSFLILVLQFVLFYIVKPTDTTDSVLIATAIFAFSVAFFVDLNSNKKIAPYAMAIFIGYLWRVALVYFDIYGRDIYHLPNSGADSNMYYRNACLFVETGDPGLGEMFSRVMGTIYKIVGTSKLYGQFIVALFSIVSLLCLMSILLESDLDEKTRHRVIGCVALLPNFAILSSIFLRESVVAMFISLSLVFFMKWMKKGGGVRYILALALVMCGAMFHSGSVAVALGYLAVLMLYDQKNKVFRLNFKSLIPSLVVLLVLAYLFINYADVFFGKMTNVSSIADVGSTFAEGGSSYAAYVGDSSSVGNMIVYTIPRIVYFLFSPFPWQWRGLGDIIAFFFSGLFYLWAYKTAYAYLRHNKDGKNKYLVIGLIIISIASIFVFGWGCTNTGTACRHRDKLIVIFSALWAVSRNPAMSRKVTYGGRQIM